MPDNGINRDDSGLKLGERLRSARKARAVSLERLAELLNLDEAIVLALEEERFEELGAPVFVRGHLKAYAKLVGLDAEALLSAYEPAAPEEVAPSVGEDRIGRSVTINPMMLGVSMGVVFVVIALTAYVMQDEDTIAPLTDAGSTGAEPVAVESSARSDLQQSVAPDLSAGYESSEPRQKIEPSRRSASTVAPVTAPAVIEPVTTESAATEPADLAVTEVSEPVARPPADGVRLSLLFHEESWVEISDVNRRLIFGLQREGRRREVVGEPPIRLLLGNAKGVELSVNDEPYPIPASRVNGKVARFEIGTDTLP